MAETQSKTNTKRQVDQKSQDRKKRPELATQLSNAPDWEQTLSDHLLEGSLIDLPTAQHAALLTDPRFAKSVNDTRRGYVVSQLQRSYGNTHVQRLLSSRAVQAKLTVNPPDDQYEREADRLAATLVHTPDSQVQRDADRNEEKKEMVPMSSVGNQVSGRIQRQAEENEEEEEEEEETVQMKAAGSRIPEVPDGLETSITKAASGSGNPLPEPLRASLEPRLQRDFSRVRIHTDSEATRLSQQLGAKAFTTGQDIFFGEGAYQPDSESGRKLIVHEMSHVVQQGAGRVSRQPAQTEVADEKKKGEGEKTKEGEVELSWWQEYLLEKADVDPKMVMRLLNKAGGAIKAIFADPGKFVNTLVSAVGQGFRQFADNIEKHLMSGLMEWLFGTMSKAGIELPRDYSPKSILQLVLQVLGISVERIKEKVAAIIGTKNIRRLEKAWEILTTFMKEGIGGLWEMLKDYLADLKENIIDQIKSWLITKVITAAILKIASMFNPVTGLINIVKMIYNVIVFLIEKARQIIQLFSAIADSVYELAMGNVKKAADKIEQTLASLIPIAIGFLASLLGISGLADRIKEIIKGIQARVDKALDQVIGKVAGMVKKVLGKGRAAFAETRAGKIYGRGEAKAKELYGKGKEMYKTGKAKAQEPFEKVKAKAGKALEKAAGKVGPVPGKKPEPAALIADIEKVIAEMSKRPFKNLSEAQSAVNRIFIRFQPLGLKALRLMPKEGRETTVYSVAAAFSPSKAVGSMTIVAPPSPNQWQETLLEEARRIPSLRNTIKEVEDRTGQAIQIRPSPRGSYTSGDCIYIDTTNPPDKQVDSLRHEISHLHDHAFGREPVSTSLPKDQYVKQKMDNEIGAQYKNYRAYDEGGRAGAKPLGYDGFATIINQEATRKGRDLTEAEKEQLGKRYLENRYRNVWVGSKSGENYYTKWEKHWDAANRSVP